MAKYLKQLKNYLQESLAELKKVKWLTLDETLKITSDVLMFVIIFVIFFAVLEIIFWLLVLVK